MSNALIRKLEHGASLTAADRAELDNVCERTRHVGPRQDIIQEGDRPNDVRLVLEGFACRYKLLPDGNRQIMALLIPGDFCDLHVAILGKMDHSIATISACKLVDIPRQTILRLGEQYPAITRALWWCTLVDEGTLREWLVSMGQRPADKQLAHLLCELLVRLDAIGMTDANSFNLPLTQTDVAEALGATTVHVNRIVQSLRRAGLITWKGKLLTIPDPERLKSFCGFTPNYLHLSQSKDKAETDSKVT